MPTADLLLLQGLHWVCWLHHTIDTQLNVFSSRHFLIDAL